MTRARYPLIRDWLAQPHIGGWWGDADTEIALMDQDMDTGTVDMRLVHDDANTPFAYVQDYDAHLFDMPHYADQPTGARALDTFLGAPSHLGQGHASAYLAQRAQTLITQGAPCVLVDPDINNPRAIATYKRAGFTPSHIAPCEDGDPVQILIYRTPTAQTPNTPLPS